MMKFSAYQSKTATEADVSYPRSSRGISKFQSNFRNGITTRTSVHTKDEDSEAGKPTQRRSSYSPCDLGNPLPSLFDPLRHQSRLIRDLFRQHRDRIAT